MKSPCNPRSDNVSHNCASDPKSLRHRTGALGFYHSWSIARWMLCRPVSEPSVAWQCRFIATGLPRPAMGSHLHPLVWDSPENPRVHLKYNGGLSENVRCILPALGIAHRLLANDLDRVSDELVCDGLNPSPGSCHEATVRPHRGQARSLYRRVTTFTRHTRRPQTCGSSEASRAARYRGSDSGAGSVRSRR